MTQAISQDEKVNPEVAAPGLAVNDNFRESTIFDEVLKVNINLDYSGWLERWTLKNFQGLGETFNFGTKLYLDFRARVAGAPVHAVHARFGKGPSPYPRLTTVKPVLTHWRSTGSDTPWRKIKQESRVWMWVRGMGTRLGPSKEPLELTLSKIDKKFDLEYLDSWDRKQASKPEKLPTAELKAIYWALKENLIKGDKEANHAPAVH